MGRKFSVLLLGGTIAALVAACGNAENTAEQQAAEKKLNESTEIVRSCDIDAVRTHAKGILTLSWVEQSKICQTIVTSLKRQPETKVFRAILKASSLLELKGAGPAENTAYQIMNIIEARGLKQSNRMMDTIDVVWRIFSGSQGHVTPRDLNIFLRNSGPLARSLSDDGLITMAAVIWEKKKARGE